LQENLIPEAFIILRKPLGQNKCFLLPHGDLIKGECIAISLEFTPNLFCIRGIKIISYKGKIGVKADIGKNSYIHFFSSDPKV
jgi:hypothetical protein